MILSLIVVMIPVRDVSNVIEVYPIGFGFERRRAGTFGPGGRWLSLAINRGDPGTASR